MAVGNDGTHTLAELLNGRSWRLLPTQLCEPMTLPRAAK
jgi:hypothetical protein